MYFELNTSGHFLLFVIIFSNSLEYVMIPFKMMVIRNGMLYHLGINTFLDEFHIVDCTSLSSYWVIQNLLALKRSREKGKKIYFQLYRLHVKQFCHLDILMIEIMIHCNRNLLWSPYGFRVKTFLFGKYQFSFWQTYFEFSLGIGRD